MSKEERRLGKFLEKRVLECYPGLSKAEVLAGRDMCFPWELDALSPLGVGPDSLTNVYSEGGSLALLCEEKAQDMLPGGAQVM